MRNQNYFKFRIVKAFFFQPSTGKKSSKERFFIANASSEVSLDYSFNKIAVQLTLVNFLFPYFLRSFPAC